MGNNLPVVFRKKSFYSFVFEDEDNTVETPVVNDKRIIIVFETVNKAAQYNQHMIDKYMQALQQLMDSLNYDANILGNPEKIILKGNQETIP